MDKLQTIYRARESHHAHMLKSLLSDYDVRSEVIEFDAAEGELTIGYARGVRAHVVVFETDVEIARGIAAIFERNIVFAEKTGDNDLSEPDTATCWSDWPECPVCRFRRVAICPICQTESVDLPLGYVPDDLDVEQLAPLLISSEFTTLAAPPTVLLVCEGCDEPFPPVFLSRCVSCDHDFGDGIDSVMVLDEQATSGISFVVGMILIAASLIAFFVASH